MSDADGGRFNAMQASPEQIQQRLRQLGIGPDATTTAATLRAAPSADPAWDALLRRNEARKLAKEDRAREYRQRLEAAATAAAAPKFDGRQATAEQAAQHLARMGLSLAGLEPLREPPPPAQLPPDPRTLAADTNAKIEAAARELLTLERSGTRIDARQIGDRRVFARYLALKHATAAEWQYL